jgi:hypothetical protein
MQSVIMHPGGVVAGIQSENAKAAIDVSPAGVETVVRPSNSQTSIERLQIYAAAYHARLLECLRLEFPAVAHAAGQEAFDAFALGYLQAYPSHSYTLAKLGERFPKYLAETRPSDARSDKGPSWPDFLIDLALLERAYAEVFDGSGVEGQPLLAIDDLLAVPQSRWPDVKLIPADSLRLMTFRFPVHEYATAVRNSAAASLPEARPTFLAITRRDYVVRRHEISETQFTLLNAIVEAAPLGEAIARAANIANADIDALAADLRRWFTDWTAAQFFRSASVHSAASADCLDGDSRSRGNSGENRV